MVKMSGTYLNEKHCKIIHGPSQSQIETDAPKDNHGRGENFSPTDLLGAALGSCMLTVMAIWGEQNGLDFSKCSFEVAKEMTSNPRRVASLPISLKLPSAANAEQQEKLQELAHNCPVKLSLNPEIKIQATFEFVV